MYEFWSQQGSRKWKLENEDMLENWCQHVCFSYDNPQHANTSACWGWWLVLWNFFRSFHSSSGELVTPKYALVETQTFIIITTCRADKGRRSRFVISHYHKSQDQVCAVDWDMMLIRSWLGHAYMQFRYYLGLFFSHQNCPLSQVPYPVPPHDMHT